MNSSSNIGLGAVLALVIASSALYVQHRRHDWPFSLHHLPVAQERLRTVVEPASSETHRVAHTRTGVEIPKDQLQTLGVRTERVQREIFARSIRAVATVSPDESRVSHVHTRVAGWLEKLHVNTTGQSVRAGQPLAEIFSQELLSSQLEYLAARRAAALGPRTVVADAARSRLKVLGISDAEIDALEQSGEPRRLVTVSASRGGIVLRLNVSAGMAVDPSTELVTVGDLSRVWVLAEVSESDVPFIDKGSEATLEFAGSGRPPFNAKVDYVYPTLSERTRTLRVRFVADNADGKLRPGLYGSADFHIAPRQALTVARDAVVDTGAEQHVFVVRDETRFEPRPVKLGARLSQRVEIREGLSEGELVVASGVFLIDSESRLRASGGAGVGHAGHGAPKSDAREAEAEPPSTAKPAAAPERGASEHQGH